MGPIKPGDRFFRVTITSCYTTRPLWNWSIAMRKINTWTCKNCSTTFTASSKEGKRIFCSQKCANVFQKKSKAPIESRFWNMVVTAGAGECWLWTGFKHKGYGRLYDEGRGAIGAHRVSYEIHNGMIPDGMCVLHRCDNPECTNPNHLFLGDRRDNTEDCVQKGRNARGSKSGQAKLDDEKVIQIRASDRREYDDLAKRFGVTRQTIRHVASGKGWKHLKAADALGFRLNEE